MRRKNTEEISEIISRFFKESHIDGKINERILIDSWNEIVGKTIANMTSNMFIRNKILFVSIQSSVVRNELLMVKSGLIIKLNEKVGKEVITEIIAK